MTLKKLAALCGCSVSTVSKAFHQSPEISESTRERIFAEAKKAGCFSKYYSPRFKNKVFAVICPEIVSPYYASVTEALHKKASKSGDTVIFSVSDFSRSALNKITDYYINFHKVDGIIFAFTAPGACLPKDIPSIMLGSFSEHIPCDCVNISYLPGIYAAVDLFRNSGHTKIGYIGEYLTASTANVFKSALSRYGINIRDEWIITSSERMERAGYDGMERLLSLPSRPSAVFCAYDSIAVGAMKCARDHSLRIPEDISFIAKDNDPQSAFSSPALTSISLPIDELAQTALDLLYKRIASPSRPYQAVSIQSSLAVRGSVFDIRKKSR